MVKCDMVQLMVLYKEGGQSADGGEAAADLAEPGNNFVRILADKLHGILAEAVEAIG